jgi:hypothetical protein
MSFQRFYQPYFAVTPESDQEQGLAYGYYLVRKSDDKRFFISKVIDVVMLEKVAEKVLNENTGYDYWIDRSLGKAVDGKAAWMNVDFTNRFI